MHGQGVGIFISQPSLFECLAIQSPLESCIGCISCCFSIFQLFQLFQLLLLRVTGFGEMSDLLWRENQLLMRRSLAHFSKTSCALTPVTAATRDRPSFRLNAADKGVRCRNESKLNVCDWCGSEARTISAGWSTDRAETWRGSQRLRARPRSSASRPKTWLKFTLGLFRTRMSSSRTLS